MKKVFINILALSLFFSLPGCSKDFLNLDPQSTETVNTFYETESDIKQAVSGCYTPLRDLGRINYWLFGEMRSDNSSFQYNNTNRGLESQREFIDEFLVSATAESVLEFWEISYKGIANCNDVLGAIGNVEMADASRNQYTGEAEFIRAFHYFNLVRQYGGVPLRLKSVASPDESKSEGRASVEEVYNAIITDITDAAGKLPATYTAADKGRVTKGAAETLLAKVYMTQNNWDAAIPLLRSAMTRGYALLPDYKQLLNPANKNNIESIFELQYLGSDPELSSDFLYVFAPFTSGSIVTGDASVGLDVSSGWNIPTADMLAAYETGDKRKDACVSLGYIENGNFIDQPYVIKYNWGFTGPRRTDVNFIVLRYADVLLMLAECLNEKGYAANGEAFNLLNQVRTRAGLEDKTAAQVASQQPFRDAIAHERQVELAFENHRWYDIVRTGKAVAIMTAHGQREAQLKPNLPPGAYIVTENKLLLPIPQREVTIDNLEQNPQ